MADLYAYLRPIQPVLRQSDQPGARLNPVLDGLLYHESDLEITEHYTDTAGFTEHVFALMHLLGFAFAPRIRDLHDKRLFIHGRPSAIRGFSLSYQQPA